MSKKHCIYLHYDHINQMWFEWKHLFILQWHVGFYAEPYFPTKRGFDSNFGYLTAEGDYFTHFGLTMLEVKYVFVRSHHLSLLGPENNL